MSVVGNKIRVYDLAREVKQDTKRIIEELRREGADVDVPSNSVSKELAEKIRNKYFPKIETAPRRLIKVIKRKPLEDTVAAEDFSEPRIEEIPKPEANKVKVLTAEALKPRVETPIVSETSQIIEEAKIKIKDVLLLKPIIEKIKAEEASLETNEKEFKELLNETVKNSNKELSNNRVIAGLKVDCRECLRLTKHDLIYFVEVEGVKWNETYQIVQCMGCESLSFRRITFKNNNQSNDKEEIELYPSRIKGRQKLKLESIPPTIAQIYEEIHLALSNRLLIVATTGMRTLIELVCNDLNSRAGNLKDKIDDLVERQLLTPKNAINLHKLRNFGNDAAHEASIPSENTLNNCIDIIEHLLKDIYSPEIFS
jgi:hypothetical protein